MGVYVVRALVNLRELLTANAELARRFNELAEQLHKKLSERDRAISTVFAAIRELVCQPELQRAGIRFTADVRHNAEGPWPACDAARAGFVDTDPHDASGRI
jgi:uncharacterized membrane protein